MVGLLDDTHSWTGYRMEAGDALVAIGQHSESLRGSLTARLALGEPDDVASVATLLAAEAGDYITGEVIAVDGGTTAR